MHVLVTSNDMHGAGAVYFISGENEAQTLFGIYWTHINRLLEYWPIIKSDQDMFDNVSSAKMNRLQGHN